MPWSALALLALAGGALGTALISQFVYGYDPCVLCLWQRIPYVLAVLLAILALLSRSYGRGQALLCVALCVPVFLAGAGIAMFHSGVELHWWLGTEGCAIQPLHGDTNLSFRERLLATPTAHCDQISWVFLGLSMANWNIAVSLALACFAGAAVLHELQKKGNGRAKLP